MIRLIARTVGGREFVTQLDAFSLILYPGSKEKAWWYRLRFMLRSLWYLHESRKWFRLLNSIPSLQKISLAQPRLVEKLHRPYLKSAYSVAERFESISNHYMFCLRQRNGALLIKAAQQKVRLATLQGRDGETLCVISCPPRQFEKEGEIIINLMSGDVRIYTLAFTVVGTTKPAIHIGCMQGPASQLPGKELIRRASKTLHGLRPRSIVLITIQQIAKELGVREIIGVGNDRHIYRSPHKRRSIQLNYDKLWLEMEGQALQSGDFLLPLETPVRALQEIASRKRAEASRRYQVLESLRQQITAAFSGFALSDLFHTRSELRKVL